MGRILADECSTSICGMDCRAARISKKRIGIAEMSSSTSVTGLENADTIPAAVIKPRVAITMAIIARQRNSSRDRLQ